MPRYRVSGLPSAAGHGTSAFFPHFNRMAASGAQAYKTLRPGSGPASVHEIRGLSNTTMLPDKGDIVLMGTSRTQDAPPVWVTDDYDPMPDPNYRPGLLIQMYDPVSPHLTTMVPVPAVSLRQEYLRRSAKLSAGVAPASIQQGKIPWPPRLLKWPTRNKGTGVGGVPEA